MKLFCILLLISCLNVSAQTLGFAFAYSHDEEQIINFEIDFNYDSILRSDRDYVRSPSGKIFGDEEMWELTNGNRVFLNSHFDGSVLYREFSKDSNLLFTGELIIDSLFKSKKQHRLALKDYGIYSMVPHGLWQECVDEKTFIEGYYEFGEKKGNWLTYSPTMFLRVPLIRKLYENNELLLEENLNRALNEDAIDLLAKNWIGMGSIGKEMIFFQNSESDLTFYGFGYREGDFRELTLNIDNSFMAFRNRSCGTGPENRNYYYPTGNWEFKTSKNGRRVLIMLDLELEIYYISNDYLILYTH